MSVGRLRLSICVWCVLCRRRLFSGECWSMSRLHFGNSIEGFCLCAARHLKSPSAALLGKVERSQRQFTALYQPLRQVQLDKSRSMNH